MQCSSLSNEAASIASFRQHEKTMGSLGMAWVCSGCNTSAFNTLEPGVTGGFGRVVLQMTSALGGELELLTTPQHLTLDFCPLTSFPRKQTHFRYPQLFKNAFEDGLLPETDDVQDEMQRYELVINVSKEQSRLHWRMPSDALRRELNSWGSMVSGMELLACPHFSETAVELALRKEGTIAYYRRIQHVAGSEAESAGWEENKKILVSIRDLAPTPAAPPSLSSQASSFFLHDGADPLHYGYYIVDVQAGGSDDTVQEIWSDREIV